MDKSRNSVAQKCLQWADALLDGETAPTAETAGTVKDLVETAIKAICIDCNSPIRSIHSLEKRVKALELFHPAYAPEDCTAEEYEALMHQAFEEARRLSEFQ